MYALAVNQVEIKTQDLNLYLSQVKEYRKKLVEFSYTIPAPLGKQLRMHYEQRIKKAKGQLMLGEMAIFIFSDLLSVPLKHSSKVAFPWLLLYEHALLLDDILDERISDCSYDILLSQILLDNSNLLFGELFEQELCMLKTFERYRLESMVAMTHEIEWSNGISIPTINELFLMQGRKAALAKYCAAALLFQSEKKLLNRQQEEAIDYLCSGIQLLDDFTDWNEDYLAGRFNFTLQEALNWLKNNMDYNVDEPGLIKLFGPNQILVSMIFSGAVNKTWEIASNNIKKSLSYFSQSQETGTYNYFDSIIKSCTFNGRALQKKLEQGESRLAGIKKAAPQGENALIRELNSGEASLIWKGILGQIGIGPVANN